MLPSSDFSPAVSDAYADIILRNQFLPAFPTDESDRYFVQPVNTQYSIVYAPLSEWQSSLNQIAYYSVPKLFTFLDTVSLESSGILAAQLQPYLSLGGSGVLIGFLDSGIDYTHPAFRNQDGTTRILRLWDQTDTSGPSPSGISYGTEYTDVQINEALFSGDPLSVVPQKDELGHGTAVAGIACGGPDSAAEFTGAAPQSSIVFVKLRTAKPYLRDYFLVSSEDAAFQETDLMLGIRYLTDTAAALKMPLVICITLGTNQGGHTGETPFENVLTFAQFTPGIYAVTGTGNEVGYDHHYEGRINRSSDYTDIELLVDDTVGGFTVEFWADAPELYSIGFTSPLGETIQPIQPRFGYSQEIVFLLENSRIRLTYHIVEILSGALLAQMRFQSPSPGIWRIRAQNKTFVDGTFHLWLPITGLVDPAVRFYTPSVDTTLVIPSCAESVLTCSTYNAYNSSLYIHSGRGYTRNGRIKPDFASPGVNLTAPSPGSAYQLLTGSCAATALTAGAVALLIEGGLSLSPPRLFTPQEIKSLFLRGTRRSSTNIYPNREWGYGTLNLFGIFESFLRS